MSKTKEKVTILKKKVMAEIEKWLDDYFDISDEDTEPEKQGCYEAREELKEKLKAIFDE
jgi:hypothetical protein